MPDHSMSAVICADNRIMERRMEVVHAEIAQTQKTLAEEVFRFHVIAESNSVKDQRIKLHVRDTYLAM